MLKRHKLDLNYYFGVFYPPDIYLITYYRCFYLEVVIAQWLRFFFFFYVGSTWTGWAEAGSPVNHRANTETNNNYPYIHTHGQLLNLHGQKLEHPEETHSGTMENTQTPHTRASLNRQVLTQSLLDVSDKSQPLNHSALRLDQTLLSSHSNE